LNLADTHCHLNFDVFKNDIDDVLDRAWEQGIKRILIPAIDLATCEEVLSLCDRSPNLFAAIGIHPNEANQWTSKSIKMLESFLHHPKVVAVGEIGLDYYRMRSPISIQKEVFEAQLEIALEYDLPVIVHSRKAAEDAMALLTRWQTNLITHNKTIAKRPGVLHSYDGKIDLAKQAAGNNFFIGVDGPVTFPKSQVQQEILNSIPPTKFLLETDAPFLTPIPHRGKRNEPSYIRFIAAKIAELKKVSLQDIAVITSQNAETLFAWGASV
jgi:TatD DNase family protein